MEIVSSTRGGSSSRPLFLGLMVLRISTVPLAGKPEQFCVTQVKAQQQDNLFQVFANVPSMLLFIVRVSYVLHNLHELNDFDCQC